MILFERVNVKSTNLSHGENIFDDKKVIFQADRMSRALLTLFIFLKRGVLKTVMRKS